MDTHFAENVTIETPSDPLVRDMEVRIELTPTSELADDAFVSSIRAGDRSSCPKSAGTTTATASARKPNLPSW